MSTYNKYPEVKVKGYDDAVVEGYAAIVNTIKERIQVGAKHVVVVDCYPGADEKEIAEGLKGMAFDTIICSNDCALQEEALTEVMGEYLTDDRVFGVMNTKKFKDFFISEKLEEAKQKVEESTGTVLVYGVAAGLITTGDTYIFVDMARWEIQMRYRKGMSNWNVTNPEAPILTKYKRAFFLEWRMADRHKMAHYKHFDFVLDTNVPREPKMITAEAFFAALDQTAQAPFRVVPYFDPGVWGGQWMKEVCDLDRSQDNFAWSFDGVPEENSLYLRYGDVRVEVPSINVVLYRPENLLGDRVHARFGKEFPIRFDFLDTMGGQNLSLQVHPTTEYIQDNFGMHYTQDESYYILDTKEDGIVYLGLKDDVNQEEMVEALKEAQKGEKPFEAEKYINTFKAKKHDHFLIPGGTLHCSGANTMVLEISATPYIFTFKLWDWDRLGTDGLPRPIHIEHGEQVIAWDRTTEYVEKNLVNHIQPIAEGENYREESTGLSERQAIETRRIWFSDTVHQETYGSVNMLNLVEGEEAVVESVDGSFEPFVVHYAETFIIPACVRAYTIKPSGPSVEKEIGIIKAYIRG